MHDILQGTTPDLLIVVSEDDFNVADVVKLELTFLHNGTRTVHDLDDVEVDTEACIAVPSSGQYYLWASYLTKLGLDYTKLKYF